MAPHRAICAGVRARRSTPRASSPPKPCESRNTRAKGLSPQRAAARLSRRASQARRLVISSSRVSRAT